MSNMILTQIPAQSTSEFHINITSIQCNLILSCRLSKSSMKPSIYFFSSTLST